MAEQRFYDRDKDVREAVNVTRQLPQDMQKIIAEGLSQLAVRDYQVDKRLKEVRSLGVDRVLPLYKSKNKRRDYDEIPEFHAAMNYLRILEEEEQREVSQTVTELARFAQEYVEKCRFVALLPDNRKVALVRDTYIKLERVQAQQYLEAVKAEFLSSLRPIPVERETQNYIADGSSIHLSGF